MGFKTVASLDADVTVALGKKNKETGKPYPKQAEGYYLGSRAVESKRGNSKLHFLQTSEGNLGVWGTTDLDRKLGQVVHGTMIRITSTGTKETPKGDMYMYKVEVDGDNTIDVSGLGVTAEEPADAIADGSGGSLDEEDFDDTTTTTAAPAAVVNKQKVQDLFKNRKTK
jgi:hypothetical protein